MISLKRSPTTAAYFCFVTLTTIGFGDYTPVKSFNGFEHDPVAAMKMVFTVSYCIFGMTLLSMCMNLMQEQIVEKVDHRYNIVVIHLRSTICHHKSAWY